MHGEGQRVASPDGDLYIEVEGRGPTILIAGGGPGVGHAHYHPWFSALEDRFQVVYLDYLGTGRSDRPADRAGYSIERYAGHLEVVREHLGARRMAIIGLSFGGMPALAYALARPERLTALVLSNAQLSAATWQEGNIDAVNAALAAQFPERWDALRELRARGVRSLDPVYQALYDDLLPRLEWFDADDHPPMRGDEHNGARADVYEAIVGADPEWEVTGTMAGFDPFPGLASLDVPTLVVTGRWDRLTTPAIARRVLDAMPEGRARLEVLEASAHRPWAEEPERYFATVAAFLAEATGGEP